MMNRSHEAHPRAHQIAEWVDGAESPTMKDHMDVLEMDRNSEPGSGLPLNWASIKELAYVVGIVLAAAGGYYGLRGEIQDGRRDVEALAARVVIIERGRADNIPRLEEQVRLNSLQDQRIQNLTEALGSLRQTVVDLARAVSSQGDLIHSADKREAVLEERIGRTWPHDR